MKIKKEKSERERLEEDRKFLRSDPAAFNALGLGVGTDTDSSQENGVSASVRTVLGSTISAVPELGFEAALHVDRNDKVKESQAESEKRRK